MMLRERERMARADLSSVEFVRMGSAPVSESLMAALKHALPRAAITKVTPVLVLRQSDETAATADDRVRDLREAGNNVFSAGGPEASLPWLDDDHPVSDPIAMLMPAYRAKRCSASGG
jgi:glucosamine--fructose-6-phosphate aminotransferase (isomerizing)